MADKASAPFNIYTVLTLIAMLALLAGVAYLVVRSNALFGSWNPMDAKDLSFLLPSGVQGMLG